MLAVIQDQEQVAGPKPVHECVTKRGARSFRYLEHTSDDVGQQRGIRERRQINEPHAVDEGAGHIPPDPLRQPGLAAAARASQRDEPGGCEQL